MTKMLVSFQRNRKKAVSFKEPQNEEVRDKVQPGIAAVYDSYLLSTLNVVLYSP
jgi:hypothetical protein